MALSSSEAAASLTRSYEIQKFSAGRWLLDSIADEKDVAVAMAKALVASGRAASGVRVMAVQQKPDGAFSQITIFRATPGAEPAEALARKPAQEKPAEKAPPREQKDFKHSERPAQAPARKKSRFKDAMFALQVAFGIGITLAIGELLLRVMQ